MSELCPQRTAIIISISSDIGYALAKRWLEYGWDVCGTYRTESNKTSELKNSGVKLVHCDLNDSDSIHNGCLELRQICNKWDILLLGAGTTDPIGLFGSTKFDEWELSFQANFFGQMRIVHELLPYRNLEANLEPYVLFFAGGGTNSAVLHYSAYTISKIALIKACELLDAEMPDTCFTIVGPGWVNTKIHFETLKAGTRAGENLQRTQDKLSRSDFTTMDDVIGCFDWILHMPRAVVGGRNLSVVYDAWGQEKLSNLLRETPDMYKLRRFGNYDFVKKGK